VGALPSCGVEPTAATPGPISPELVLVDPDLAAEARAALPDYPWPRPVRLEPTPARRRRRRIPRPLVGPLLFLLALVVLGLMALRTVDGPTFAADAVSTPSPPPPATTPTPQPTAPRRTVPKAVPKKPAQKAVPRERPRSSAKRTAPSKTKTPSRARRSTPAKRRQKPSFRPARTFSWPQQTAAAFYQVTFLRNGRMFYRTRIGPPRLKLPPRIQFTPGRYHWIVRPVINGALAKPIVDSTFEVGRD
jgi:hypothetical protein